MLDISPAAAIAMAAAIPCWAESLHKHNRAQSRQMLMSGAMQPSKPTVETLIKEHNAGHHQRKSKEGWRKNLAQARQEAGALLHAATCNRIG